jgi:hypothetical protein
MRRAPPISLVISRKDDKPKPFGLTNVILNPGILAAFVMFAFLASWSFIFEYSFELGPRINLEQYFDAIDYVQLTPRWGYGFFVIYALVVVGAARFSIYYFEHPFSPIAKLLRTPTGQTMAYVLLPLLFILIFAVCSWTMASFAIKNLNDASVSAIFRKGEATPIKGKLIFQLSRYVLILGEDKSVIAIPQTEVQMIQTPWLLPPPAGAPSTAKPSPS